MLQRLTPLQLRAVFDVFDADADGVCTREEVAAGLKLMGVQVDAAALEQTMTSILSASFDDDATPPNSVNFQMFSDWWQRQVILRHPGRERGVPSLRPTIFTQ
jgi:Ca2+-binding EF-hand superfamily protein